jgi:hypothetical protein
MQYQHQRQQIILNYDRINEQMFFCVYSYNFFFSSIENEFLEKEYIYIRI